MFSRVLRQRDQTWVRTFQGLLRQAVADPGRAAAEQRRSGLATPRVAAWVTAFYQSVAGIAQRSRAGKLGEDE